MIMEFQEELKKKVGNIPIKDHYGFVYGSAFFIGMVVLYTWNTLIKVLKSKNQKFGPLVLKKKFLTHKKCVALLLNTCNKWREKTERK